MSKLFDVRRFLKASIVAANIGFTEDSILIKRRTALFNDVATALSQTKNDCVLHIGVASGKSTEDADLEMELMIPITLIPGTQLTDDDEQECPEEPLWEALVKHVHGLKRSEDDPWDYRFRFKTFDDDEIEEDGTAYLTRQSIFALKLSLY